MPGEPLPSVERKTVTTKEPSKIVDTPKPEAIQAEASKLTQVKNDEPVPAINPPAIPDITMQPFPTTTDTPAALPSPMTLPGVPVLDVTPSPAPAAIVPMTQPEIVVQTPIVDR